MAQHILVVDDDAGIRDVVSQLLGAEGFAVTTARNGREALASMSQDRPALVLLDLNMPVLTGWDVLAQLRQAQAGIPVVFMTADNGAKAEAERCHADGYLAKPFDLDELLRVVDGILRAEPA